MSSQSPPHAPDADQTATTSHVGPAPPARPETRFLDVGDRLGRYVLLERLGAGGMGVVYAAYDPQLDRKVAVKVLHRRRVGHRELEARLLREAQALAKVDDPQVVQVFDVGRARARIFIAMEFIDGQSLSSWLKAAPRSRDEILRCFRAAGKGLAAAHRAGLVHRDFKAANVMVRRDGELRVLDFGLARSSQGGSGPALAIEAAEDLQAPEPPLESHQTSLTTDESTKVDAPENKTASPLEIPLTVAGTILGTPAYMAPEQRAGEETTQAADQFSFCVALHLALVNELPAGTTTPLKPSGDRRNSAELSTLDHELSARQLRQWRWVPGDHRLPAFLLRLLERGLQTDPRQRYPSMDALLADLARDPKARRRKTAIATAVIAAAASGLWVYYDAAQGRRGLCRGAMERISEAWSPAFSSRLTAAFELSDRPFARDAAKLTQARLDDYAHRWANAYTETCEATHVRGEQSARLLDLRTVCLSQRRRELGALVQLFIERPEDLVERAVEAANELSPLEPCSDLAALTSVAEQPLSESRSTDVARIRQALAEQRAHRLAGEYEKTHEIVTTLVEQSEKLEYWPLQAEALLLQGMLEEDLARFETAAQTLEKAVFAAEAGGVDQIAAQTFVRLVRFAAYEQGDIEKADYFARLSTGLLNRLDHRQLLEADLADHRGMLETRRGNPEAAVAQHRQALELRRGIDNPVERSRTLIRLGTALKVKGDFEGAREPLEAATAELENSLGPMHPRVAAALDNLGNLDTDLGRYEEARESYERALGIYEQLFGAESAHAAPSLLHLGTIDFHLGNNEQAMQHFMRSAQIIEQAFGPNHANMAAALINIGLALNEVHEEEQALTYLRRALDTYLDIHGEEHWLTANALYNLGETWNQLGDYRQALDLHERAIGIWTRQFGRQHFLVGHGLFGLGRSLVGLKRYREAIEPLQEALALWPTVDRDPVYEAETRFEMAKARWALGEHEVALVLATEAKVVFAEASEKYKPSLQQVEAWIAKNQAAPLDQPQE